jgi:hypothetical protein
MSSATVKTRPSGKLLPVGNKVAFGIVNLLGATTGEVEGCGEAGTSATADR